MPNPLDSIGNIGQTSDNLMKNMTEKREEEDQYKRDTLDILRNIEKNTAGLTEIISLIQESNENQQEVYSIITELLALAKESDGKELESKYRKVMKRISEFSGDVLTMQNLMNVGLTIYNITSNIPGAGA